MKNALFWGMKSCFWICGFNVVISQEFFLHVGWVKSSYNTCGKWRKASFRCTLPWHPADVIWHAVNLVLSYCHHGTSSGPSVIKCVCFHCTAGHWWYCRKLQKYTALTVQPPWDLTAEEDSVDISSNRHQFVSRGKPERGHFLTAVSICAC
jgi:hypothetical protein